MDKTIATYPRQLRTKERNLLEFVLPLERSGYGEYRNTIEHMIVLAAGRRGEGNIVLGYHGATADIISPLSPVIAYGMLYTTLDTFSVTVREIIDDQVDIEIVSSYGREIPEHFEEKKRWTYSTWQPGMSSPETDSHVREVSINTQITLAIAPRERRIWLYDVSSGMNQLIPVTNFHNEVMLHKGIRDPKIALNARLMFDHLESYSDDDLRAALIAYNKIKKRVDIPMEDLPTIPSRLPVFFNKIFQRKSK